jgi:hypothetical protein
MNTSKLLLVLLVAVSSAPTIGFAADADAEAGLAVVTQLGGVNGTALACSDMKAAARARQLMLAHAPKTRASAPPMRIRPRPHSRRKPDRAKLALAIWNLPTSSIRLSLRLAETLPVTAK